MFIVQIVERLVCLCARREEMVKSTMQRAKEYDQDQLIAQINLSNQPTKVWSTQSSGVMDKREYEKTNSQL